jgi:hypothetical protein
MTMESMASPGVLKRRPVLDSDAPYALGRKKGGNRQQESSASARGARRNEKLPRAAFLPCTPPTCYLLLPRAVLFTCALLPRVLPFAPARCPPPVRSSPVRVAFCSCALPSSCVLFSCARCLLLPHAALCSSVRFPLLSHARCRPHSIARHHPWLGSCHPCLPTGREGEGGSCSSTGRESCLLSARGLLWSSVHGLLCSLFLGMLLCSSQLCLALES